MLDLVMSSKKSAAVTGSGVVALSVLLVLLALVASSAQSQKQQLDIVVTMQTFYPGSSLNCEAFREAILLAKQPSIQIWNVEGLCRIDRSDPSHPLEYCAMLNYGIELCSFLSTDVGEESFPDTAAKYAAGALALHDEFIMKYACELQTTSPTPPPFGGEDNYWSEEIEGVWDWEMDDYDSFQSPLKHSGTHESWTEGLRILAYMSIMRSTEGLPLTSLGTVNYVGDSLQASLVPLVKVYTDRKPGQCRLILGIRGTSNLFEWSLNFMSGLVTIGSPIKQEQPPGSESETAPARLVPMAHEGYVTMATSVWPGIRRILEPFLRPCQEKDEVTQIFVGGHSLGGALANLLGLRLSMKYQSQVNVTVVSFGAPNLFNWAGREVFRRHVRMAFNLVGELDPIPNLPCLSRNPKCASGNRATFSAGVAATASESTPNGGSQSFNSTARVFPQVVAISPFGYQISGAGLKLPNWYYRSIRDEASVAPAAVAQQEEPKSMSKFPITETLGSECYVPNAGFTWIPKEKEPKRTKLSHSCVYFCHVEDCDSAGTYCRYW